MVTSHFMTMILALEIKLLLLLFISFVGMLLNYITPYSFILFIIVATRTDLTPSNSMITVAEAIVDYTLK